jgi:hypothetical protein
MVRCGCHKEPGMVGKSARYCVFPGCVKNQI